MTFKASELESCANYNELVLEAFKVECLQIKMLSNLEYIQFES